MLTSLYIHVPFCKQICTYCDFHKEMATLEKETNYIKCLIKEMKHYKGLYGSLETIFIGGGTPSGLNHDNLVLLLDAVKENIDLKKIVEYSIETNPNDITDLFAQTIREYGINRVSVGVQTFNETQLRFLGRAHNEKDITNAVDTLKRNGISNISIDMIFSLIDQSIDDLNNDIDKALKLDVNHISYYSLILEEKTKLYNLILKGKAKMNSEDLDAEMYDIVIDKLIKSGYKHYEISNFSKNNTESLHNLVYWENKEYLGLGSGSHSLYNGERFGNVRSVAKYITSITNNDFENKDFYYYEPLSDELLMGLRKINGINIEEINAKYDIQLFNEYPELAEAIENKLLEIIDGYLHFTRKGILLGNEVFRIFVEVK